MNLGVFFRDMHIASQLRHFLFLQMISENKKLSNDERNRRVGKNQRNQSNEVFQFGSNLAYPNGTFW